MATVSLFPTKPERLWKQLEEHLDRYGYSEELRKCIRDQCAPLIPKYAEYELNIDLSPDLFPVILEEEYKQAILERFKKVIAECVTRMQKSFFGDLIYLQAKICILQDEIK